MSKNTEHSPNSSDKGAVADNHPSQGRSERQAIERGLRTVPRSVHAVHEEAEHSPNSSDKRAVADITQAKGVASGRQLSAACAQCPGVYTQYTRRPSTAQTQVTNAQ